MFRVTKQVTFDAAHYLRNYKGKCKRMHGHTYLVQVSFEGALLDERGILVDFGDVKKSISENVVNKFDHTVVNDIAPFDQINPTAELMAKVFFDSLKESKFANGVKLVSVTVWETPTSYAEYYCAEGE